MWLGQLERHFRTRPFTDEAKKFILMSSVEGRASLALEGLRRIEEATYLEVVNQMKLVIYGEAHTSSIGNVFSLVQHDPADSFIVYAHKVRAMLKHFPEIARFDENEVESFMIADFLKGLPPARTEYVRTRQPKTLNEAAWIAARVQLTTVKETSDKSVKFLQNMETVSHAPSIAQPYSRQSGPAPPQNYPHASRYNQPPTQPATFQRYSSVGSMHSDHLRYTGRYPGEYRVPSSSNHSERQRDCWNCGSLDHYRRECPNPPRNESRAPVTNPLLPTSFRVEHTYTPTSTRPMPPTTSTAIIQEPTN